MSIVIVRNDYGYTASLRFADKRLDVELSSGNHWGIYEKIEKYVGGLHGSL